MAEITRRRVRELQREVFKILLDHPDGLPAKDVLQGLEQVVPPSDFEKSNYPRRPNIRRFEKMARFSTIAPVKAGCPSLYSLSRSTHDARGGRLFL